MKTSRQARGSVREVDAAVIGAGPAGTTAATLLARAGFRVGVWDKATFPRPHVGESLLPSELRIFERLGLELGDDVALFKSGAEFYDEGARGYARYPFADGLPGTPSYAYQVDRAGFDQALLSLARDAGAEISLGTRITHLTASEQRATLKTESGETVHARYVLDATGQDAFSGRQARSLRPIKGFGIGAVGVHFSGLSSEARAAVEEHGDIKILILEDGWSWTIPLPGGRLSVGRVSRAAGFGEDRIDELVASSPLLQSLTEGASRSEAWTLRNFSFVNDHPDSLRRSCIGDAAAFLDPVFSSGISLGMVGAERIADRLIQALMEDREADVHLMEPVREHLRHGYVAFGSLIKSYYHTNLVNHFFFHPDPEPELRAGLITMLAGDLWRDDNRFQNSLLRGRRRWEPAPQPQPEVR